MQFAIERHAPREFVWLIEDDDGAAVVRSPRHYESAETAQHAIDVFVEFCRGDLRPTLLRRRG